MRHAFNTLCDNTEISALHHLNTRSSDDFETQASQLANVMMFKRTDTLIEQCLQLPGQNHDILPVSTVVFYMIKSILYRGINYWTLTFAPIVKVVQVLVTRSRRGRLQTRDICEVDLGLHDFEPVNPNIYSTQAWKFRQDAAPSN